MGVPLKPLNLTYTYDLLTQANSGRAILSPFSSDSKFRTLLKATDSAQSDAEIYTNLISTKFDIEQLDKLEELKRPVIRVERSMQVAVNAIDRHEQERILDWASQIPYKKHFKEAHKKALKNTGQWLFQHSDFFDWKNCSSSQILQLHGGAGAGKSTLLLANTERTSVVLSSRNANICPDLYLSTR